MSNEKLILLYKETENKKNKEIIFKKLYANLERLSIKICSYYSKILPIYYRETFYEEAMQEAKICLLKCIEKFTDKRAKFLTFYYKSLSNHIKNLYESWLKQTANEFPDNAMIEWKDFGDARKFENIVDRKFLREIFDKYIEKVYFSKPIHKSIFIDYIGFTEDKNTDETFSSLSRKYNLTRMAVGKICSKYIGILKDLLDKNNYLEKIKEFELGE